MRFFITLNLFLTISMAQHLHLKLGETRRGEKPVQITKGNGKTACEVRLAIVGLNGSLKLRSHTSQDSWSVFVLFDPSSGFYWWTYAMGPTVSTFNISDAFTRLAFFHVDQNSITSIRSLGVSLSFNRSTAKANNADDAVQKAVSALDQILPEITNHAVFQLEKQVSLVPPFTREFFELSGPEFISQPIKITSISHQTTGWRVSFTSPNQDSATVLVDNGFNKAEIVTGPTPPRQ